MSAAAALQKAIFQRLSTDAALMALVGAAGVTDRLLAKPSLPLVVIRSIDSSDRSTATEEGEEHLVTIDAWSENGGHLEVQTIAARVRLLLHDADLTIEGFHLVSLLHRTTRIRRDGKTRYHRAEMRFRAVTE
ncbi:DUF3168 domain-containing protein [Sinorhizobium sp. BG8]|uniref:DUF3168 domain-containing protein n=1 Tax=Sinorhizobium sp. BG8 TaxID=2613773 RepID=UPI00193CDC51|nr:DUF3168 domain-containing protein [Sinorhizobium sp. BG8]QRM54754.1 DUF3168 domain-containing protein [Sinorhizobium sp. BG8]